MLAILLFRHQAWYSYATTELAYAKAALASFEEIYDVFLGKEMHDRAKTQDSRVVKDVLRALCIAENENLRSWQRGKVEYMQQHMILEGMVKSLDIRCRLWRPSQSAGISPKSRGGR